GNTRCCKLFCLCLPARPCWPQQSAQFSQLNLEHSFVFFFFFLSFCLSACLSVCLSVCLSLYMSVCLSVSRESVYRLLPQTTPENISKNFGQYTLDPHTRYPNVNKRLLCPAQVNNTHTYIHTHTPPLSHTTIHTHTT